MFKRIEYKDLKARQQENYNFQKVAGHLADYGYNCIRLSDDWQGADFIAYHINGDVFLKVQLKSRLSFDKKYVGKDIWIAFLDGNDCFVYPHDKVLDLILAAGKIAQTVSWENGGKYNWNPLPKWGRIILDEYKV